MNKIFMTMAGLMLIGWSSVSGDMIPGDSHYVERSVYLTNVADFPDVTLIGYITGPMVENYSVYVVQSNVPLDKGYKFNKLRIFALKKSAVEQKGGLAAIDFKRLAAAHPPAEMLDPAGYYLSNDHALASEAHFYRISQATDATMTLTLDRSIYRFKDGTPDRVITY